LLKVYTGWHELNGTAENCAVAHANEPSVDPRCRRQTYHRTISCTRFSPRSSHI